MGRKATVFWHAALSVAAGVLYFFFVLPRWPELMGDTSHALGTAARIVAGLLVGLAALPVVLSLVQLRKPEFGTPALALNLRTWSVVSHVVAGVLIVGTAIAEIWLNLDSVGQWLFGIYGAAAAIALLGIAALQLSFVAEQPPPPPKPLRPAKQKRGRGRKKGDEADETETEADTDETEAEAAENTEAEDTAAESDETAVDDTAVEDTEAAAEETAGSEAESTADEPPAIEESTEKAAEEAAGETIDESGDTEAVESGGLRNKRPIGKGTHRRRRSRRGVAIDE